MKQLTDWIAILATSAETDSALLAAELGFARQLGADRELRAPRPGLKRVRFIEDAAHEAMGIEFHFEPAIAVPEQWPRSGETAPWHVTVTPTFDAAGRVEVVTLDRHPGAARRVDAEMGFDFATHLATTASVLEIDALLAPLDVPTRKRLDLARLVNMSGAYNSPVWNADHWLPKIIEKARVFGLPMTMRERDRATWPAWQVATERSVRAGLDEHGVTGFELGRLAGALQRLIRRIKVSEVLARNALPHPNLAALAEERKAAHAALKQALIATGTTELIALAETLDHYADGAFAYLRGALQSLIPAPPIGEPTEAERELEARIMRDPLDTELRLAWSRLAIARDDPRGGHVLTSVAGKPAEWTSEQQRPFREPLEALGAHGISFDQGFASALTIDIDALLTNAERLASLAPLKTLTVTGSLIGKLDRFLEIPQLQWLERLTLGGTTLDVEALKALLPRIPNVRALNLEKNRLTREAVEVLCQRTPAFETLNLYGNGFHPPHDSKEDPYSYEDASGPRTDRDPEGMRLEALYGYQPWMRV